MLGRQGSVAAASHRRHIDQSCFLAFGFPSSLCLSLHRQDRRTCFFRNPKRVNYLRVHKVKLGSATSGVEGPHRFRHWQVSFPTRSVLRRCTSRVGGQQGGYFIFCCVRVAPANERGAVGLRDAAATRLSFLFFSSGNPVDN